MDLVREPYGPLYPQSFGILEGDECYKQESVVVLPKHTGGPSTYSAYRIVCFSPMFSQFFIHNGLWNQSDGRVFQWATHRGQALSHTSRYARPEASWRKILIAQPSLDAIDYSLLALPMRKHVRGKHHSNGVGRTVRYRTVIAS